MPAFFRRRRVSGCRTAVSLLVLIAVAVRIVPLDDDSACGGSDIPERQFVSNSSVGRYVTLCKARMNGDHRIGNHLFLLAAMLYVAEQTNRSIVMKSQGWCLDDLFKLNCVLRYNGDQSSLPGTRRVMRVEGRFKQSLDGRLSDVDGTSEVQTYVERNIQMCGMYQTTVYADAINAKLRRLLKINQNVELTAARYLDAACPEASRWFPTHVCIGVHVRRGDFLDEKEWQYGLTTITDSYLRNAMQYFIDRYQLVQFVIASDDQPWVRATLREIFPRSVASDSGNLITLDENVLVTLSVNQSAAVDFAMLTMCDGLVISTGSFGW